MLRSTVLLLLCCCLLSSHAFVVPGSTSLQKYQRTCTPLLRANKDDADEEQRRKFLASSGLEGRDLRKLNKAEQRDADWFSRQAQREQNGELNAFEDPLFYVALFALTPVVLFIWGVLACYIPIYCAPE